MKPNDNSEIFLDALIQQIQIHLQSVGGIYITTALYPPSPLPLPGIKTWTGYTIPPAGKTPPSKSFLEKVVDSFIEAVTFTPEEEAAADFASEVGYGGMESTAIGITVGAQIAKGAIKIENIAKAIPPKEIPAEDKVEPNPTNDSESIQECGDINLPQPNAYLIEAMKIFEIDTPIRKAHFLAQCAHESGGFKWVREFASGKAYEGRLDLGNTEPGDGVRFKGRGYIQLTGRANYKKFSQSIPDDVVSNPILVEQQYVAQSAGWFWKLRKFNSFANDDTEQTLKKVTKRVNGGYNGYEERKKYFCGYWKKLQEDPTLYT